MGDGLKTVTIDYKRFISALRRLADSLRRRKFLLLLVLVDTFLFSAMSIFRHRRFESAWDLAVFDQAIWLYSRGGAAKVTVRTNLPENLLGDHFHPIVALLAPVFWIVDTAEALLVTQSFLLALSVVPVFLFAERRHGKAVAWIFGIAYSLYWALQRTAEFEFHEIAVAVPLIAFAVYFIDLKVRKGYFACLILLLLTKENLSALVAFFGIYLLLLRQYKDGLISLLAGAACFPLITKVFMPFFSGRVYRHWTYEQLGPDLSSALATMVKRPLLVFQLLTSPEAKLRTAWMLFFPFLFFSVLSPILILAVPIIFERFLSSRGGMWEPAYHYNAALAPILALAAIDGLARIARLVKFERVRRAFVLLVTLGMLLVNLYLLPTQPLWVLTTANSWRLSDVAKDGLDAVKVIPRDATVVAQVNIAPHLTHRRGIYIIYPNLPAPDPDYAIASSHVTHYPHESFQEIANYITQLEQKGYVRVFDRNGWIVVQRPQKVER